MDINLTNNDTSHHARVHHLLIEPQSRSLSVIIKNRGFLLQSIHNFKVTKDQEQLLKIVTTKMPFGKYEGRILADLPVSYLEWFNRKGFPKGSLGTQLSLVLTLKSNGMEEVIYGLKKVARNG
jgi:uncharacterized protein